MSNNIDNVLKEYVKGLFKIVGKDLKKVILYGSYARGEEEKNGEISDVDIMILVDANEDKIKNLEQQIIEYSYDLDLQYDILLSPIIENIENYNKRVKYMAFYKNIKEEGVLLNG